MALGAGSAQVAWLEADLAQSNRPCQLAYWHHPRFSSGLHGDDERLVDVWRSLEAAGVDVVVTGHDHEYERFAPMRADGSLDSTRGIRSFVVGTGGQADLRPFAAIRPHSETRIAATWGLLKLTLQVASYEWEFVPVAGQSASDRGSGACH